jgi:hypothetical protein
MQHACCELASVFHLLLSKSARSTFRDFRGSRQGTTDGAPTDCGMEGANSQTGGFTCPQCGRARRVLLQEEDSFAGSEPAWVPSRWAVWRRRRSAARTRRPARIGVRPDVPEPAAVRRGGRAGAGGAARHGHAGGPHGRAGQPGRGTRGAGRGSEPEREQPEQQHAHRRHRVHGPVPRP